MPGTKKRTKKITDQTGEGDCYEVAAHLLLWPLKQGGHGPELGECPVICHGIVTGQGPVEGLRFGHAWIETTRSLGICEVEMVIDHSNGKKTEMPAGLYYLMGRIDPSETKRYTKEEARLALRKHKHYGPWD
jgi:hypothetical protein